MHLPSRPGAQSDPVRPLARPSSLSRRFTDSDPTRAYTAGVRGHWTAHGTAALRYLHSNPDIWTTISGSGTDIFRMRACNTHSKPRATRCNFCPMRLCRVPHTARCRTDCGGSGTSVPRQRYLSNLSGRSQPMAVPSQSAPQADLVHPWARPSSLSRRFSDSDPTRAAVTQTSAHTRIDVHGP